MTDKDKTEARASIEASTVMYVEKSAYDAMAARVQKLEAALREVARYAKHELLCGMVGGYGCCTCGLDALLTDLAEQEKEGSDVK